MILLIEIKHLKLKTVAGIRVYRLKLAIELASLVNTGSSHSCSASYPVSLTDSRKAM